MFNSPLSLKTTHIGSLPFDDPEKAVDLVLNYFDIPAWPQLPKFKNEEMTVQFTEGLPGFNISKRIIDLTYPNFEQELLQFYEKYFEVIEKKDWKILENFSLSENFASSYKIFLEKTEKLGFSEVKGQITGPFTLATSLKTQNGEILIYNEDLRDLVVKFITLKALSQALDFKNFSTKIIFLDEPGLAGFGSSSFITISKDIIISMLHEIIIPLQNFNILTGIHICANTSWDMVLESKIDILSFDSFNFYDKLIIYKNLLKAFLEKENKYLAWGVIPTDTETLKNLTLKEIIEKFEIQLAYLSEYLKISRDFILHKSLFTPACGLGNLSEELALKVLRWLKDFKNYLLRKE